MRSKLEEYACIPSSESVRSNDSDKVSMLSSREFSPGGKLGMEVGFLFATKARVVTWTDRKDPEDPTHCVTLQVASE